MSYDIFFTSYSKNDLCEIKKYICNNNFAAAQKVVKHIIESVEKLKETPSIGRAGRLLGTRELIITKYPYIVPYKVIDNNVYILRVLHTSRKWE